MPENFLFIAEIIAQFKNYAKIYAVQPLFKYKDDQYMFKGITHTREIVRAILIDENNNVCIEKIVDDDGFGPRDYYETPGGGIKNNEDLVEGLKREIAEECGYLVEIIGEIGEVDDFYNLIHRENHNYYFIARVIGTCDSHLEPDEVKRIKDISFHSIDESIHLYEKMQDKLVGKLVKQRELPLLKILKDTLQSK